MNKSKFLKKSLAMVLAVMLVVAMIPLGASAAATPPVISRIVVGYGAGSTSEAEVSGNTFTAKFPATENEFSMAVIMKEANGTPYYVDANNEDANFTNDQDDHGIWYSPALYADKFDNNTITIHTVDTDGNDGPTYTLKLERVSKDPVNTVDSFTVSGQYNDTVIDHIKVRSAW